MNLVYEEDRPIRVTTKRTGASSGKPTTPTEGQYAGDLMSNAGKREMGPKCGRVGRSAMSVDMSLFSTIFDNVDQTTPPASNWLASRDSSVNAG